MKLIPIGENLYRIEQEAGERAEIAAGALRVRVDECENVGGIAFVSLAENGVIDDATAGEHTELFAPWSCPNAYEAGQLRQYEGQLYRCILAHTSQEDWTPDASPSLWARAANPTDPWPEWSLPVGAHDVYALGDRVSHNGKHWVSDVDNNAWEPSVYGWTEVTEDA